MDFNEIAGMWDTERRIKRAKQISDFILSQIDIDKNSVLLDFGCGTGLISQNMINHVSKVIGYDQSEKMLEIFDSKFFDIKDKVISTNTLDDFNECIDIVLSSMVFHHIEDIDCTMQYLRKSLKVNGKLMIIDLDKDDGSFHKDEIDFKGHHGFDRKEFINRLNQNGFKLIKYGTVLKDVKYQNEISIPYSLFYVYAIKIA